MGDHKINSTHIGQIAAGVTWQNGCGATSSPVDKAMRDDLGDATEKIANIRKTLPFTRVLCKLRIFEILCLHLNCMCYDSK